MYYIWFRRYKDGKIVGGGVLPKAFARKDYAERAARRMFASLASIGYEWKVSEESPWGNEYDKDKEAEKTE